MDDFALLNLQNHCAFLNAHEPRRGRWTIAGAAPNRMVHWQPEIASDSWRRERSIKG